MRLGAYHWEAPFGTPEQVFLSKGINGRWADVLTDAESSPYQKRAGAELGPRCAKWIASGEHAVGPGGRNEA